MKHTLFLPLLLLSVIFCSSCSKHILTGTGTVVTREVPVSAIASVALHYGIQLEIRKSDQSKMVITGYENLLNEMPNIVSNGHLDVTLRNGYERLRNNNISVVLHTQNIQQVSQHGSGNLLIKGFMDGKDLEVRQHGSGEISVSESTLNQVIIRQHGSGNIRFSTSPAKRADVAVNGSGKIYIEPVELLKVAINGSGDVYYKGNPVIQSTIQGSGRLIFQQ
jgi:Putative auto-transporter adhesin, head GIN domain